MSGRMPACQTLSQEFRHGTARLAVFLGVLAVWLFFGGHLRGAPDDLPPNSVSAGGSGATAADSEPVAGGATKRVGVSREPLLRSLYRGGPTLFPIAACSFLLVVFFLERLISLRRARVIPRPFVRRFLHQLREGQLDQEKALELCDANASPVSDVFAAAVKKWGRPSTEVEQAILDAGERVTNQLRKYLRLFNGIYTVTPLFGLLGTVLGMIESFHTVANGNAMGRAELLAGGISQALISTAAGLSVAIPALIVYLYFLGRLDSLIVEIDDVAQQVANGVAADGWKEKRRTRPKAPPRPKAA